MGLLLLFLFHTVPTIVLKMENNLSPSPVAGGQWLLLRSIYFFVHSYLSETYSFFQTIPISHNQVPSLWPFLTLRDIFLLSDHSYFSESSSFLLTNPQAPSFWPFLSLINMDPPFDYSRFLRNMYGVSLWPMTFFTEVFFRNNFLYHLKQILYLYFFVRGKC